VSENRVLKRIFGLKGEEVVGDTGEDFIMRSCMNFMLHQILLLTYLLTYSLTHSLTPSMVQNII
jgi:hypothetical protein